MRPQATTPIPSSQSLIVADQGLSVEDDLSYLREYEHVTLSRALIAQHQVDRSLDAPAELLDRLLVAANAGGRVGTVIEILVLQSLATRLRGHPTAALVGIFVSSLGVQVQAVGSPR